MNYILTIIASYLIGSIPFGLIFAKLFGKGDVREIGSGNIGATNVLRTGSKSAAILTLLFDGLKGYLAVYLAGRYFGGEYAFLAAFAALIGHCYPIFLRFQGGKGVATYIGVVFGLSHVFFGSLLLGFIACGIWLITAILTRLSSLSALVMVALMPMVVVYFLGFGMAFVSFALMGVFIAYRHRENIKRLIAKTEPKIGKK